MSIRKLPPMCWQFPRPLHRLLELVDADPQLAVDVMAAATRAARQAASMMAIGLCSTPVLTRVRRFPTCMLTCWVGDN